MKKVILRICLIYVIRDVLYFLSFSFLGQGIYNGIQNFFNNFFGSLIFMLPTIFFNFIITGVPFYFIFKKIKDDNLRILLFFCLVLIDLIFNSFLFNLNENYLYMGIRIFLFSMSIFFLFFAIKSNVK